MQIAGHRALDYAVETKRINNQQSQSEHLDTHTHADIARMSVTLPLARLKRLLDKCIQVDLEYVRLKTGRPHCDEAHPPRGRGVYIRLAHESAEAHCQMLERLNC